MHISTSNLNECMKFTQWKSFVLLQYSLCLTLKFNDSNDLSLMLINMHRWCIKALKSSEHHFRRIDGWLCVASVIISNWQKCSTSGWECKMCMHDADSSSPTTEQNMENVFQLIHRINSYFFSAIYAIHSTGKIMFSIGHIRKCF